MAGLRLKPRKCNFALEYLGHLVSADGVRTDPKKLRAPCPDKEGCSVPVDACMSVCFQQVEGIVDLRTCSSIS